MRSGAPAFDAGTPVNGTDVGGYYGAAESEAEASRFTPRLFERMVASVDCRGDSARRLDFD